MLPIHHRRIAFAATIIAAVTLVLVLSPIAGAQERREQRDAPAEETPVVLQVVAASDEKTPEPEPPDSIVIETPEPDPPCPEGWAPAEPPLNPDLGCLPQNASGGNGSGDGGGDNVEAQVAVVAADTTDVAATDDLAVENGTITIEVRWCPNGGNGIDYTTVTLPELMDACQEPGYGVDFTLDLGYWSGSQAIGDVIPGGIYWEPPLGPESIAIYGPAGGNFHHKVYCDPDYNGVPKPAYAEVSVVGGAIGAVLSPSTDTLHCAWFLTPFIAGLVVDDAATELALPPRPEEHPGHCPEGYSYELLLHEDERGNLTWLYGCVPDGTVDPTGPDDIESAGGRPEHPGHSCPEGYSWKLLLRENADGSLTWLYGCVPDGSDDPSGPDDIGTGGDGGRGDSPRIVPVEVSFTADPNGAGADGCPEGHFWTDGPLEFPNWPVDTNGDGHFDSTDTLVVYGGCVPDSGQCPEDHGIHPAYTEYGCLRYGTGPWTT
jgi:hypothetical protein